MTIDPTTPVYVVDDDEAVRDSVKAMLEAHDFQVIDFPSGADFLTHRTDRAAKGCVLLDMNMPGMTGLQVLQTLRGRGDLIPVLLITGRPDQQAQDAAVALGGVDLLSKPIRHKALVAAVSHALDAGLQKRSSQ